MKKLILLLITFFSIAAYSQNTATLTGSGTDADGTIVSFSWKQVGGPAGAVITSPGSATTTVTGLVAGVYQFALTVTDNLGSVSKPDTMQITVLPGNISPKANAGVDQTIKLPGVIGLNGKNSYDPDGRITAWEWQQIYGPRTAISYSKTPNAGAYIKRKGLYAFQLTVTDDNGAKGRDYMLLRL